MNHHKKTSRRSSCLALAATLCLSGIAFGQQPDSGVQQQFNEKVRQRNTLIRQLQRLDQEAFGLRMAGEPTIVVNAKQQSLQDELNVVETRLTIMSSRYDLEVPAPPAIDQSTILGRGNRSPHESADSIAQDLTPDGVYRTNAIVEREILAMLADLEFASYPETVEGGH